MHLPRLFGCLCSLNGLFYFILLSSQGWKWHSPACYWVGEDLLTFDEARKSCEDNGAALVTITNRYIQHYLVIGSHCSVLLALPFKHSFSIMKGSSRPLPTAWCLVAPMILSGLASATRAAPAPSTGSAGMRSHTPTGIETSQVGAPFPEASVCISMGLHHCITAGLRQLTEGEFSLEISCCHGF